MPHCMFSFQKERLSSEMVSIGVSLADVDAPFCLFVFSYITGSDRRSTHNLNAQHCNETSVIKCNHKLTVQHMLTI